MANTRRSIINYLDRYKNLPNTVKASLVFLLASLVQKGLVFITSPIFTRIMPSQEYGVITVFTSLESLLGTIAMFCLSLGCFDIGMMDYKEDRDKFCFSLLILSNFITIIIGIIVFALYDHISNYIGISKHLLLLMFTIFLLQPAYTFWIRRERFEYHYKKPGIATVLTTIISTICAVACVFMFPQKKIEARLIGQYAPLFLVYIVSWFFLAKESKWSINYKYIKFAFAFNLPLIPHYLSSYVLNSSDRLMINAMVGSSQAAYYGLAYSISAIMTIIWSAINSSLVPYVLNKYEKREYEKVSNTVIPILAFFSAICLLVMLLAPEIISLLGPEEYREAISVVPPVIGGVFFQSLYFVFTNVLYYLKKPRIVMCASLCAAILNILLNLVFIKRFGYCAAGYTTLFCYGVQALIDYIIARKYIGQDIYKKRPLIVLSLSVLASVILCNTLYQLNILRYGIIGVFIISLFLQRRAISQILVKE